MNHDPDLAAAYVLDALSPEERARFEDHLATCAPCQAEVAELRQVVDVLPLALEPAEPSPALRDRIIQAASADIRARPQLRATADIQPANRVRWLAPALAAAAAVVIVALGSWNLALRSQQNSTQQQIVALLAKGAPVSAIRATGAAAGASASLVRASKHAYLVVQGLPPSPSNKVYQVWYVRGTTPHSAGIFRYSHGTTVVQLPPAAGYALAAVTVEPGPHGSRAPTSPQVLSGKLSA